MPIPTLAGPGYIPGPDAQFDEWFKQLNAGVTAIGATALGTNAAQLASCTAAYTSWHAAYEEAAAGDTRTRPVVAVKNENRKQSTQAIRIMVKAIRAGLANLIAQGGANAVLAASYAYTIGIRPVKEGRRRTNPPGEAPIISVVDFLECAVRMKFEVEAGLPPDVGRRISRKAKPYGVRACQIAYDISNIGSFVLDFTRTPFVIQFPARSGGQAVAMRGRWVTTRGEVSRWSAEVLGTIPTSSPYAPMVRQLRPPELPAAGGAGTRLLLEGNR